MNVRRTFVALSLFAATALVAAPAFAAGPFGNTGRGGQSGPFTPGANGPSGPMTPGDHPSQPSSGPFTPGANGNPSGPFTPGDRPAGNGSGPFSDSGKKSGGFWGGVKHFFGGVAQVFSKVFDFVAMFDLMGRWFGALIPHGATGTMADNGTGSNVGRNTNTNPPTMNNQPPVEGSTGNAGTPIGHTGSTQPGHVSSGAGIDRGPIRTKPRGTFLSR
jgi:hypothetical protein